MKRIANTMLNPNVVTFDSLAEMEDSMIETMFFSEDKSFVGRDLPTLDAAIEAANQAWKLGLVSAEEIYNKLKDQVKIDLKSTKRKIVFSSDDGDEVDLDKLLAGQPYLRQSVRQSSTSSTEITLVVQTTTDGRIDSKNAMWRGLTAIVMAELLEEAGHRVKIVGCQKNNLDRQGVTIVNVTLKDFSDPIDRSSLINALSGWYHRTVRFTALYTIDNGRSHLRIEMVTAHDLENIVGGPEPLGCYVSDFYTEEGAIRFAVEELEKLEDRANQNAKPDVN